MDIPAAVIYYEDTYHLFYLGGERGSAWGHAAASDLMHWEQREALVFPDNLGSPGAGCIVEDIKNTSGLGTDDNPPLVAIFTCTKQEKLNKGDIYSQTQVLAYSRDQGNTWIAFEGNPVIPNPGIPDFRDPKVFWYEQGNCWVMLLAVEGRVRFYTSSDLKNWTHSGDFGTDADMPENIWERPDLFELQGANQGDSQWILTVNIEMGLYKEWVCGFFAGTFDGKTFTSTQTSPYRMDYGKDNYGGTTFEGPGQRRIWIGWMNNREYADAPAIASWAEALTIPRDLHLEKTPYYTFLASLPVKERSVLYREQSRVRNLEVKQDIHSTGITDITPHIAFPLTSSEINIRFKANESWLRLGAAEKFGLRIGNSEGEYILVGYDAYHQQFYTDRSNSATLSLPQAYPGVHLQQYAMNETACLDMQIILDTSSLEMFAMDGKIVLTERFYPSACFDCLEVFAENGKVYVESISVTQLATK
jgi:fructan beta-fructosidase